MEKYPIFSGLKSLTIENLSTSKGELPKHGAIGEYLKTGDVITFDLDSKDIWLDIQVECPSIKLVIFFEAKVNKKLKIEVFMQYLIEIINQILKANYIELRFDISNMELSKMHLNNSNFSAKNLKSSMLAQGVRQGYLKSIEKEMSVFQVFDYLDRAVLAEMEMSETEKMNVSELKSEVNMVELSELPIRGLRVEKKKAEETRKHKRGVMNSNVCSCLII